MRKVVKDPIERKAGKYTCVLQAAVFKHLERNCLEFSSLLKVYDELPISWATISDLDFMM